MINLNAVCENVKKVISAQTTSGYCITKKFAQILLKNFKESQDLIIKFGRRHEICLDQYWKRIQPMNNWYVINPVLGYQYENYSDIEKKQSAMGVDNLLGLVPLHAIFCTLFLHAIFARYFLHAIF